MTLIKHFFTTQVVKAPYGTFTILGFRTLTGEKYAQLKEVSQDFKTLRHGELALPLSILEPQPFFIGGQVYATLDEIKGAIKDLEQAAKYLENQAETYRARGKKWECLQVSENANKSQQLANDLKNISSEVYP